jgi:hypothetical protein
MAKPAVTLRSSTAPTPLTYAQLDTNFTNLRDATISLTAGTGGTQVTSDLNGNITLVAGTGITFTADNTAKTITINSAAGGVTSPLSANLDLGNFKIVDTNGVIVLDGNDGIRVLDEGVTTEQINLSPFDGVNCVRSTNTDFNIRHFTSGSEKSRITFSGLTGSSNKISLWLNNTSGRVEFANGLTIHEPMTTTTRNGISGVNGMIIYNSTVDKFQGFANGWVDLH